jgi:hypothetical protein
MRQFPAPTRLVGWPLTHQCLRLQFRQHAAGVLVSERPLTCNVRAVQPVSLACEVPTLAVAVAVNPVALAADKVRL